MVVILGAQTENCTLACLEILKVINSESVNDSLGAESEQSTRYVTAQLSLPHSLSSFTARMRCELPALELENVVERICGYI